MVAKWRDHFLVLSTLMVGLPSSAAPVKGMSRKWNESPSREWLSLVPRDPIERCIPRDAGAAIELASPPGPGKKTK